uniref:CMP-N-acetylneuraminate-beta-galactosamide-alpha-2,3-sialyltransferase 2 n=1 Tax=Monopterus albus TaxID=43700 RepID=A0A3Q3JA98_MONAL
MTAFYVFILRFMNVNSLISSHIFVYRFKWNLSDILLTAQMMSKLRVFIFLICLTVVSVLLSGHNSSTFPEIFRGQDRSLCTCETCLSEDDLWLANNTSVEPFLSAKYNFSEDVFEWWKLLQDEQHNFTTYRKTVKMLFQIFPPNPVLTERCTDGCRSCAVVGNSGNLRRSHYGPLIDAHDVVIRMNSGHTKGYEADVGKRTTHHIMYPESAKDLDNSTHLVLIPFKILDLEWLIQASTTGFYGKSYKPVKSNITVNKDLVMVMNPAFMRYVHDAWLENEGKYPSTGFMAVILALHTCDEVHVFGYGADEEGNWSHYWDPIQNSDLKTGVHAGTNEYEIIQQLARKQKLKFYRGW